MEFELPAVGEWGWVTGIPPGGHLSDSFTLEAYDALQADGSTRVFAGTVAGNVARVVVTLSSGQHMAFKPRSVPEQLRKRVVWLRNTRYFVQYYPPTGFVTSASLLSASGQLLYRASGDEFF